MQLSKQKALASTPVKRVSEESLDTRELDIASKRRRFTARRNLLLFYKDSEELGASMPSVQVSMTVYILPH